MAKIKCYVQKEGYQEEIENSIAIGIETGTRERKIQIAKNIFVKSLDITMISECTGLTTKKIENLK